jgi:cytochrome c-type biogenesis protein CcmH/NrfG
VNFGEPHYCLAKALASQGDLENAIAHHQQALRVAPDWVDPMSGLAWILATAADPDLLRPAEAVRLTERAAALTERQHVGVLDTLAAAYAAAGRGPPPARRGFGGAGTVQ